MNYQKILDVSKQKKNEYKKLVASLKKKSKKQVDEIFHPLHEEVFEEIDCLKCANCCKTTGPLFTQNDIERISAHQKMKPAQFIQTYLHIDEDNDYVLQKTPCTFLSADNYCTIYEVRPKACKAYPHTNQNHVGEILDLTLKNAMMCPAVAKIFEKIKI